MTSRAGSEQAFDEATALARGHLYSFFAGAFADPSGAHFELALDPNRQRVAVAAADLLRTDWQREIEWSSSECCVEPLELRPAVAALNRPRPDVIAEHHKVFGLLGGKAAPLNETEYCRSTDAFYRAQELADIAGFYRAFGLRRDPHEPERCDHVSLELDFMARLIGKEIFAVESSDSRVAERADVCHDAQRKFFEAHLGWWLAGFERLLRQGGVGQLYGALTTSLTAFIAIEGQGLGVKSGVQELERRTSTHKGEKEAPV